MGQGPLLQDRSAVTRSIYGPLQGVIDTLFPPEPDVASLDVMGPLSAGSHIVNPLISIFKNGAGEPSKALREMATKAFVESARAFGRHAGDVADEFASRYPRVAAHLRINPEPIPTTYRSPITKGPTSGYINTPPSKVTHPMDVSLGEKYLDENMVGNNRLVSSHNMHDLRRTMAHEGMHGAQALGNSQFHTLYDSATDAVGYMENPFEVTARLRGEVGMGRPVPTMVMKETPETYEWEKVVKKDKNSPAEHRLLVEDILHRLRREAGREAYNVPRALRNMILYPERYMKPGFGVGRPTPLDAGRPEMHRIKQILQERGNLDGFKVK